MPVAPLITYALHLKGVELTCVIGIFPEEQQAPQRVRLDGEIQFYRFTQDETLDSTLCYAKVIEAFRTVAHSQHWSLLETLGEAFLSLLFTDVRIHQATLSLSKPDLDLPAEHVGITLSATRPS